MLIRRFIPEDAEVLSRLIVRNLREVNIRDYSSEAIDALVSSYSPERLIDQAQYGYTIVCVQGDDIVGTASLDGDRVRNVFVDIDMHKRGIGRRLVAEVEAHARDNGLSRIHLLSGITAQGFYRKLGYQIREHIDRELNGIPLPMIKMERELSQT